MSARAHFRTSSPEETRALGRLIGAGLEAGSFVGFVGELGSGKTVAIQGAARALGFDGHVSSPSFVIVNEYDGRLPIYHVDLYRVSDEREVEDLDYREFFFGDGVALVEWADRAPAFRPAERIDVAIGLAGGNARTIDVTAYGERAAAVLASAEAAWNRGHDAACHD